MNMVEAWAERDRQWAERDRQWAEGCRLAAERRVCYWERSVAWWESMNTSRPDPVHERGLALARENLREAQSERVHLKETAPKL